MLDALVGKLSFDPLAFTRMKPADQAAELTRVLGLDFTAADAKRTVAFDARSETSRKVKLCNGVIATKGFALIASVYDTWSAVPDEKVDVAELTAQLTAIAETQRTRDALLSRANEVDATVTWDRDQLAEAKKAEVAAVQRRRKLEAKLGSDSRRRDSINLKAEAVTVPDAAPIRDLINAAGDLNNMVDHKHEYDAEVAERLQHVRTVDNYTADIAEIDDWKSGELERADYPVPGLGFGDDSVTFDGIPFSQAATSRQIRV